MPYLVLSILIACVEILCRALDIPAYLLPAPSLVYASLWQNAEIYLQESLETLGSTLVGFLLSLFCGTALALILSLSASLRRLFLPISVFFQTVPVIAVAPLLVIWFGFGAPTVRASAFIVSFFPVLAGGLAGLTQVPAERLELFRMLKAGRLQRLVKLELPSAVPSLLTGAKVAAGLSVVGAIVGEFVAGTGLGSLIDSARTQQRTEMVFAAILCSTLLGLVMIALVETLGWSLRKYRDWISV